MKPDMKVRLAGLELVNPVIAASGTFGYGIEFEEIARWTGSAGLLPRALSLEPMAGHPAAAHCADGRRHAQCHRPAERRRRGPTSHGNCHPWPAIPSAMSSSTSSATRSADYIAVIERLNQAGGIAAMS